VLQQIKKHQEHQVLPESYQKCKDANSIALVDEGTFFIDGYLQNPKEIKGQGLHMIAAGVSQTRFFIVDQNVDTLIIEFDSKQALIHHLKTQYTYMIIINSDSPQCWEPKRPSGRIKGH